MQCSNVKSLNDLPEEILIVILQKLDTHSKLNIYNTSKYLRFLVCIKTVTKAYQMSLNCLATASALKLNFFKDISKHLEDLDMSGVADLTKTSLISALKKLKTLKTLNVSYTPISIKDILDVYSTCPTVKNITINFIIGLKEQAIIRKNILQYQTTFGNFENVHLVGHNLLYSDFVPCILCQTDLKELKFTEIYETGYRDGGSMIQTNFKYLVINLISGGLVQMNFDDSILPIIQSNQFEFIVIALFEKLVHCLYASPGFATFFKNNMKLNVKIITELTNKSIPTHCKGMAIMVWNKEKVEFDSSFYYRLFQQMKTRLPCHLDVTNGTEVPLQYEWYCMEAQTPHNPLADVAISANHEIEFKKRRMGLKSVILNYNDVFKDKQQLQLSLIFKRGIRTPVSFPASCDYLGKITNLSLTGTVCYKEDFFNTLFQHCDKLVTLNVEACIVSPVLSISKSIILSKTLRNFRLIDNRINFKVLFQSLSQCSMLENLHIIDVSTETIVLCDPSLIFKNCDKLYSFFIHMSMNATTRKKNMLMLKSAKLKYKRFHLNIGINSTDNTKCSQFNCYPFIKMFNILPIKDI